MLASTFQHLRGIGPKTEQALWRSGVESWDDFESRHRVQSRLFTNGYGDSLSLALESSRRALRDGRVGFFADSLARREHYRIPLSFPSKTIFLDIETTGLSVYYDQVTVVGWSTGSRYNAFIAGGDESALRHALSEAGIIVTFNGSLFDLPFLRERFKNLTIPPVHVDLRFLARRVGLAGGQKNIELAVGIRRPRDLEGLRGEAAPLLWHKYKCGDIDALKLLLAYNHADVEGMKGIFDAVIRRLRKRRRLPPRSLSIHLFSAERSQLSMASDSGSAESEVRLVPYLGKTGPAIKFDDLGFSNEARRLRIVGIDPTGSSSRPSGWCATEGNRVVTRRIATDHELLEATLAVRPHLVSIDSPLSLPRGRVRASDDDPGRGQYGITRECERVLKKRGVNVYPCLIQSMQALTERGTRLTDQLRHLGVPVIESYPGAAQDILRIPRKRASLEFLKTGLADFGLIGEFLSGEVSHDELDAITSALVGILFWSGRFEALGNDDEGYLIIPDLKADFGARKKRRVIGLSGQIGAGKTTAGRFLESHGFRYGRFSMVLADILRQRSIEPTRQALQALGEEMNRGAKQRRLGTQLLRMLPDSGDLVIDGLRHPEDHALLVETFGATFIHVHIDVPLERLLSRQAESGGNPEELRAALSHPVEMNVPTISSLAHVRITNDTTLDDFFIQLGAIAGRETRDDFDSASCL
jgi:uncharacterized protein YprB with RNaseH-like and TPR domain/predicted nuclease with RNAse H fold/dephospho-CoA kinase